MYLNVLHIGLCLKDRAHAYGIFMFCFCTLPIEVGVPNKPYVNPRFAVDTCINRYNAANGRPSYKQ